MDTAKLSLELHQKHRGKLETKSKVPLHTREDLSLAYTPGVAAVCQAIVSDKTTLNTYTNVGNTVAVITDGSAVLGLGNIGPEAAMPVMEGKAILFKEFGGVDAVPICLSTQDTEEIIKTITAIAPSFGGINLEDISAPRCFEIEERLKQILPIPVFHDDQHGTAIVVLAGLINALKIVKKDLTSTKVVITGAGAAGMAITKLLLTAGLKNFGLVDSKGLICHHRLDLNPAKANFIEEFPLASAYCSPTCPTTTLANVIADADILIGVSGPNTVTAEMIKSMAPKAIVFAMANPTPEIMPDVAKKAGAYVVATGRSDFPNQVNNVLAFPGLFRGLFDSGAKKVTEEMKISAARAIASCVTNPTPEEIIPSPFDKKVAKVVADAISKLS
ncbi:MAG: malate dehydrogenase [Candidatus Vogelbacteria bacterium RIFOXYD1_FULL_44_32]|uniref:Malate dehydrogenase n=1 Tax=Candidatus Vogelbacteria bacterium RIFOXYD1_FULL_44_32 TaxID=1802438 RepID=A0A1G2QG10_9BACT|nr:MAG: malate dehydrogenase [Candidatus Vogelbacteria bacterium RIFOXYD1_FULL_44_32]